MSFQTTTQGFERLLRIGLVTPTPCSRWCCDCGTVLRGGVFADFTAPRYFRRSGTVGLRRYTREITGRPTLGRCAGARRAGTAAFKTYNIMVPGLVPRAETRRLGPRARGRTRPASRDRAIHSPAARVRLQGTSSWSCPGTTRLTRLLLKTWIAPSGGGGDYAGTGGTRIAGPLQT